MDPHGLFDGQWVEWYGDVYTDEDFSTIVPGSAEFDIEVPAGHTFELIEPFPICEVYVVPVSASADWKIRFRYQTTNGDNHARIQVIAHEEGDLRDRIKYFLGYSGSTYYSTS